MDVKGDVSWEFGVVVLLIMLFYFWDGKLIYWYVGGVFDVSLVKVICILQVELMLQFNVQ